MTRRALAFGLIAAVVLFAVAALVAGWNHGTRSCCGCSLLAARHRAYVVVVVVTAMVAFLSRLARCCRASTATPSF